MAYWIVRQSIAPLDIEVFREHAEKISTKLSNKTSCTKCGKDAKVKYFLWVKTEKCVACGESNDLFPGFIVAKNDRHPNFVWYCPACQQLLEIQQPPTADLPIATYI